MDFKPGGAFQKEDWSSYNQKPHWKQPKRPGRRLNNFYRIGAALLIFLVLLALKETGHPLGIQAREQLKLVLTTEWNYQPVFERIVQYGLQMANVDWPYFSSPQPVVSQPERGNTVEALPLPVSGKVVRGYGMVLDPIDNMERFHPGIDIAAPVGSPVKAVRDGAVKKTGDSPVLGRYVLIEHAPGTFSLYGNLSRASVSEGQPVKAGQSIGEAGAAGDLQEGGLHFELRENNKLIDPVSRLQTNP